jgi:hypothetical protein
MIRLSCPACQQQIQAPDETAGKHARCPHCQYVMAVPTVHVAEAYPAAPVQLAVVRSEPTAFTCPYCKTTNPPIVKSRISTAGWVLFVVLIFLCLPLCWVALFITEPYRQCSRCHVRFD